MVRYFVESVHSREWIDSNDLPVEALLIIAAQTRTPPGSHLSAMLARLAATKKQRETRQKESPMSTATNTAIGWARVVNYARRAECIVPKAQYELPGITVEKDPGVPVVELSASTV